MKKNINLLELEYSLILSKNPYMLSEADKEALARKVISNLYDKSIGLKKKGSKNNLEKEAQVSSVLGGLSRIQDLVPAGRSAYRAGVAVENVAESLSGEGKPAEIPTEPWEKAMFEATNESELYNWFQRGVAKSKDVEQKTGQVVEREVAESVGEKGAAGAAGEAAETIAERSAAGVAKETLEEVGEAAATKGVASVAKESLEGGAKAWIKKVFPKFLSFIPQVGAIISASMAVFNAYHATTLLGDIKKATSELKDAISRDTTVPREQKKDLEDDYIISSSDLEGLPKKYAKNPEVLGKIGKLCLHYEYFARYSVGFIGDSLNAIDDLLGIVSLLPSLGQSVWINALTSVAITAITEITKAWLSGKYSSVRMDVIKHIKNKGRISGSTSSLFSRSKAANPTIKKSNFSEIEIYTKRPTIKNSR